MKMKIVFGVLMCGCAPLFAASLSQSTFTEVIKQVSKVDASSKASAPAQINDVVKAPDLVRTGPASRAELTAPDNTITRIGADSVFSFEPQSRSMNLEKGSVLFHSPTGRGGGTIKSGGASAAVLGTTIIVVATPNGGFKFIVLEGKGRATLNNGQFKELKAGQLVFILPGGNKFSGVLDINLEKLVGGSKLVNGFSQQLPSLPAILAAIEQQQKEIAQGRKRDTGRSADEFAQDPKMKHGTGSVDNNSQQTAIHAPLTQRQLQQLFQSEGTPQEQFNNLGGSGLILVPNFPRQSQGNP